MSRKVTEGVGFAKSRHIANLPDWRKWTPLFPALSPFVKNALDILPEALATVWPLNRAHRKSLPDDIHELSRVLTCQRSRLEQPYWSQPRFISAYLYYFLPWNLIRFARLLPGLPLPTPHSSPSSHSLLVDGGTGPLSLPLALWLTREDWRNLPLTVLGVDTAHRPMELGLKIFRAMGEKLNIPPWPVRLFSGPLTGIPGAIASLRNNYRPFLLTAANVLNETIGRGRRRHAPMEEQNDMGADNAGLPGELLEAWSPVLDYENHSPALLFLEPGTRLGGTAIMRLRQIALDHGLTALAPCTHDRNCPLLQPESSARSSLSSAWCHFVFETSGAPKWLLELSRQAGLDKQTLSLSPLLLRPGEENRPESREYFQARVISAPFAIPPETAKARYACFFDGKSVMANAEKVPAGALVDASLAKKPRRDSKTGTPFISPDNS